jgi:hypothetical protein
MENGEGCKLGGGRRCDEDLSIFLSAGIILSIVAKEIITCHTTKPWGIWIANGFRKQHEKKDDIHNPSHPSIESKIR